VGLADGALSLLELSRAYDTVGCATASMILAKVETQAGKPPVSQMLRDFGEQAKRGVYSDKSITRLLKALSTYAKAIEDFKFQRDVPDFPAKGMGERMMQAGTAAHKAKGTLRYIALSAIQCVATMHADHLLRKGLANPTNAKSANLISTPAAVQALIDSQILTYALVETIAAGQWNAISFAVQLNGQPVAVPKTNLKGGARAFVACPVTMRTLIELKVFNGPNCKNTNLLENRFSATISYLRREK